MAFKQPSIFASLALLALLSLVLGSASAGKLSHTEHTLSELHRRTARVKEPAFAAAADQMPLGHEQRLPELSGRKLLQTG